MDFYTSIFADSSIGNIQRYGSDGPGPGGTVVTATMTLPGSDFMVRNGGPAFTFTEAISLVVSCADQTEVDYYWDALTLTGASPASAAG